MNTWFAYWRWDQSQFRAVLYGFPRPGQEPPVLGYVTIEIDSPEARALLVEKIERDHGVRIAITS